MDLRSRLGLDETLPPYGRWPLLGGGRWPLIAGGAGDAGDDPAAADTDTGEPGGQPGEPGGQSGAPGATRGASATDGDGEPDGEGDLPEGVRKTLSKLRQQLRTAQREAAENRRKLEERDQGSLTETQRLERRAREAEERAAKLDAQVRRSAIREAFQEAGKAAKAKPNFEGVLYRMVDEDSIDFGEDGSILNATELVADLKRSFPDMFEPRGSRGTADAGQQGQGQPAQGFDMNTWLRSRTGQQR